MNIETMKKGAVELLSPCYVFDADLFHERVRAIQDYLGDRAEICYAMKANPFLVGHTEGLKIEVCSPGEFAICERSGIKPEQVVLSGVNKEENEIRRVMQLYGDRMMYTVESEGQYDLLSKTALEYDLKIRVLLRLTAGNQFGMDQETISRIIASREAHPELQIKGLQYYSGTQKKKLSKIQKELTKIDSFLSELADQYGYVSEELEYGPGFYVPYFLDEEEESMEEVLTEFGRMLMQLSFQGKITLEMGRYLAGSCGYYYTCVVDEKTNQGQLYGIADGGIHQLNYYGQMMAMKIPHYRQFDGAGKLLVIDGETATDSGDVACKEEAPVGEVPSLKNTTLCGSLCTVNDILVRSMVLQAPLKGTKILFENCGAYSVTEGMALFLSRDLPRVYLFKNGQFCILRDRLESNLWNAE